MNRFLRVLALSSLLVLGVAADARAQGGSMSMSIFNDEGTFTPTLSRADLDVFKRVLAMKPDEVEAMEDLYGAYAGTLKSEGREVRVYVAEKMEESESMGDTRILAPAHVKLAEWQKRSDQLKKSFMDDLKALLTKEQEGRWPIVERELRRIKMVNWGRIPGEQVDLVKLVEDLPAESRRSAAIPDILERYSQDLDRAIQSRQAFLSENSPKFDAMVESDPEEAKKLYEKATREREAVANLNDRYLREICAEVSPEDAQSLRDRAFKASYYLLAKGTRGERYILAAGKLEGLSSEQKAQVNLILAEYDRDRRVLVGKMADLTRELKLKELPERLERKLNPTVPAPAEQEGNQWNHGLPEGHPMLALRRSRFELDRAYRTRIDATLTPEQRSKLPDQALEHVTFFDDSGWTL